MKKTFFFHPFVLPKQLGLLAWDTMHYAVLITSFAGLQLVWAIAAGKFLAWRQSE
jgi:hypothetical protein